MFQGLGTGKLQEYDSYCMSSVHIDLNRGPMVFLCRGSNITVWDLEDWSVIYSLRASTARVSGSGRLIHTA